MDTEADAADTTQSSRRTPAWWHGDPSTFTALSGFFAGMLFVIVVPAVLAALRLVVDHDTVEQLLPFALLALAVPIALVAAPRWRRFGSYFAIGMVLTAVVVLGVASLVLYFMVRYDG